MAATLTKRIPLSELQTDDRNPKAHDIPGTIQSMRRFGFVDPPAQDQRTGLLIAGHGRIAALRVMRERGDTPPDGIDPDGWKVPVYVGWASADDDEAGAALIALNRLTERGGWDSEALTALLSQVSAAAGDGLTGVGYNADDLEKLRGKLGVLGDADGRATEDQELRPFERTYFLIAAPIDQHGSVWDVLAALDDLEGVDVASSQG